MSAIKRMLEEELVDPYEFEYSLGQYKPFEEEVMQPFQNTSHQTQHSHQCPEY